MALLEVSDGSGEPLPLPADNSTMVRRGGEGGTGDVALEDSADPSCVLISGRRGWTCRTWWSRAIKIPRPSSHLSQSPSGASSTPRHEGLSYGEGGRG